MRLGGPEARIDVVGAENMHAMSGDLKLRKRPNRSKSVQYPQINRCFETPYR